MPQQPELIRVIAPDGQRGKIPAANWPRAEAAGYRREQAGLATPKTGGPAGATRSWEAPGLTTRFLTHAGGHARDLADLARGVEQGIYSTGLGVSKLLGTVPEETTPADIGMEPENALQRTGRFIEQGAEQFLPAAGIARVTRGLPLAARAAAEALTTAGMTTAQTGDTEAAGPAAALGAAVPVAGRLARPALNFVNRRMAPREWNSILGVTRGMLRNADDLGPGARMAEDGIVAGSKDGLRQRVQTELTGAGQRIEGVLAQSDAKLPPGRLSDIVLEPLTEAESAIRQSPEGFERELARMFDNIAARVPNRPMSMSEAFGFKKLIGDNVNWSGASAEHPANQALMRIYWSLTDAIEEAVPGIRPLQARWNDYHRALNAIEGRIMGRQASPGISGTIAGNIQKLERAAPASLAATPLYQATTPSAVDAMANAVRASRSGGLGLMGTRRLSGQPGLMGPKR